MIFDEVARLMAAHGNHEELAKLLGVHLTTLMRWERKTASPNHEHEIRIRQLLGDLEQGQLFHTAPGLSQSDATSRYGTPAIPGLLVLSASPQADPFRLRRYTQIIGTDTQNDIDPLYVIEPSHLTPRVFTVLGRPITDTDVTGPLIRRGDIVLAHGPHGQWRVAVVHPSGAPATCADTVLVLRPKGINGHIIARMLLHPVVLHQLMPFSTPGRFSALFIERMLEAMLPMNKTQVSNLNDWGARLAAATDECHILGNAIGREINRVATDWQSDLPTGANHEP